jgi:hypothetical protein
VADQNDPWAAFSPQATPAASPFGQRPVIQEHTPPKEATPQNPEQRTNTVANTTQTTQNTQFQPAKMGSDLGESFRGDKAVQAYREVAPMVAAAENARHDGAGDTSVVYGWAKAMDPTGSVREGDVQLAQAASGPMQRAQLLVSQYHLEQGGSLPPEVRTGLIEEMRNKARQLNLQYSAVRDHYIQLAASRASPRTSSASTKARSTVRRKSNTSASTAARPAIPRTPPKPLRCRRSRKRASTSLPTKARPRAARTSAINCSRRCTRSRSSRPPTFRRSRSSITSRTARAGRLTSRTPTRAALLRRPGGQAVQRAGAGPQHL